MRAVLKGDDDILESGGFGDERPHGKWVITVLLSLFWTSTVMFGGEYKDEESTRLLVFIDLGCQETSFERCRLKESSPYPGDNSTPSLTVARLETSAGQVAVPKPD